MKVFFYPIISISVSVALGIILQSYCMLSLKFWLIIIFIITIIYFVAEKFKKSTLASVTLFLLWISIGSLSNYIKTDSNYNNHYSNFSETTKTQLVITIAEKVKSSEKYYKYIATIKQNKRSTSFGKVLVLVDKNHNNELAIGDNILTYNLLHAFNQSKQFSYFKYLENQNIYAQLYLTENSFKQIGSTKNIQYYAEKIRSSLISSFKIHNYPDDTQQFINAFLLGERQELNKNLTEQYKNAGVMHILAISGLHISVLYGILLLLFKTLNFRYNQRFLKLFISLLFLWTFACITGLSPSVIRSVTLFSIVAIAIAFDRNENIFNALALSFVIILLINPKLLFNVGFQLSYISVSVIITCVPLIQKIHISKFKIFNYILDLLAISTLIQLFLLPLIILYFKQVPTLFLLSNIIIIPASILLLYWLVVLLILNYIMPTFSVILGKFVEKYIEFMNLYVEWIANIKGSVIQNIPFNTALLVSSYIIILALFLNLFKISYKKIQLLFIGLLLASVSFIISNENKYRTQKFTVWNYANQTIISQESFNEIYVFTSNPNESKLATDKLNNFNKPVIIKPIQNFYLSNSSKIVLINTNTFLNKIGDIDYLVLSGSPKINLDRVLTTYKPKVIICDSNNYKSYVKRWEKTCKQKNIPFYNTNKMGYFDIVSN